MRHGSLFSGQGGFDLASEWMGWKNVFHCEINYFCQRILKYYWPNAITHEDIKTTDFSIYRGRIDILTGGFPCQPFSVAGERKGTEDERHLWPEMLRAIREIEPTWIVGENVRGLVSWNGGMVFEQVCSDLEALSYEVFPIILPAAGVNAPHKRERIWFIAYSNNIRICKPEEPKKQQGGAETGSSGQNISGIIANTNNEGRKERIESAGRSYSEKEGTGMGNRPERFGDNGNVANADHEGLQGSKVNRDALLIGQIRNKQLAGCISSTWENFPTQPPLCSGNDGLPSKLDGITISNWRKESIKSAGNAVVPQIPFQIFKAIEQYEPRRLHH